MNKIKAIKGTHDILPGDIEIWQELERIVRQTMRIHGYSEIRTPVFEGTGLFARSIGEDTDIVGKEMYTFRDKGDRSLTLRPEGTASVVRAFIENSLDHKGLPQRLWYMGPFFRQERPQKGRQRQFHQFGVEVIGSSSPRVDFEVMVLFDRIAKKLGLENRKYSINSLGGAESREIYGQKLILFLDKVADKLCEDCKRRKVNNPLRVFDCKVPACREVVHNSGDLPVSVDYLNSEDALTYGNLKENLNAYQINYEEDPFLVRGLDYYTGTVFAMKYEGLGAQSEIMGGGRYDNLVKELGGPDLPSVGFACGMERLILAIRAAGTFLENIKRTDVYVVNPLNSHDRAMKYVNNIRDKDFSCVMGEFDRSMKAQMKAASRFNAKYALIIEPDDDMVSARNMDTSEQKEMAFNNFLHLLEDDTELKK
jgi:histidyl-tRNA synthetase